MRVLILEDDLKISEFLQKGFVEAGYIADKTGDGDEGLELALINNYDLLVVDIMLIGRDGLSVVEQLRQKQVGTPVLFLSAKHSVEDRVQGLQSGGDDYLTKPFSFTELLARAQAILRRTTQQTDAYRLRYQDLELDLMRRIAKRGNSLIELQQREFALLELLMRNEGKVLSKTQILEKVWHYEFDPQTNVVDVLICRIRNKIDREYETKLIKTIRGVGYALRAE